MSGRHLTLTKWQRPIWCVFFSFFIYFSFVMWQIANCYDYDYASTRSAFTLHTKPLRINWCRLKRFYHYVCDGRTLWILIIHPSFGFHVFSCLLNVETVRSSQEEKMLCVEYKRILWFCAQITYVTKKSFPKLMLISPLWPADVFEFRKSAKTKDFHSFFCPFCVTIQSTNYLLNS